MTDHIPCAPEWEAWFSDPEDGDLFHHYSVAFWQYREDKNGSHVYAWCPNYNGTYGEFVGPDTPNFLRFSLTGPIS